MADTKTIPEENDENDENPINKNEGNIFKTDTRFKSIIQEIRFGKPNKLIAHLKKHKIDYVVKSSSESTHVIYELYSTRFIHSRRFPSKFLYLFKRVRNDVQSYLNEHTVLYLPPKNNPIKFNYNYDDTIGSVIGTDLDKAYWRIAFLKGFISEATYELGLTCPSKALLQSCISVLGRNKYYTVFKGGYQEEKICVDEGSSDMRNVYTYIRYSCYQMMKEIEDLLGSEFDCYKTDCIYYRNTKENVSMVENYFDTRGFTFKNLTEFEKEPEEKKEE